MRQTTSKNCVTKPLHVAITSGFIALLLLMSGCATVFKGSRERVNFSSDPGGAKVYVNGILLGKTPLELKLQSKHTYNIEFRKEGYETRTVVLTNHVGVSWIVLDVLFGLTIIPLLVDAVTGNWYELDQNHVNAALETQQ